MKWICCLLAVACQAKMLDVEVSAQSAILINADSGAILYEKHAHLPLHPGSITKVATALFALDVKKPDLNRQVTVSAEALKIKPPHNRDDYPAHWGEKDGTSMWLIRGEILSLESLFYGMMLVSGNDAANVVAEALSPSIPQFVEEMNHYLRALGCKNTHFTNPHGLYHKMHFTTAYDMSQIMRKALHFPKFREFTSTTSYRIPTTNKRRSWEIFHTNGFLKKGKHNYKKTVSVKSGYHALARQTQIAAAAQDGRTLVAVVLGCPERTDKYTDLKRLFETAFAEKLQEKTVCNAGTLWQCAVPGGASPLQASLQKSLVLRFYPAEEPAYETRVEWAIPPLPIHQGDVVGKVRVFDSEGKELAKEPLIACTSVQATFAFRLRSYLNDFLRRF